MGNNIEQFTYTILKIAVIKEINVTSKFAKKNNLLITLLQQKLQLMQLRLLKIEQEKVNKQQKLLPTKLKENIEAKIKRGLSQSQEFPILDKQSDLLQLQSLLHQIAQNYDSTAVSTMFSMLNIFIQLAEIIQKGIISSELKHIQENCNYDQFTSTSQQIQERKQLQNVLRALTKQQDKPMLMTFLTL
ncbi:kinesin motor domain protein, putative (macronuclear) [Tetrahymena thermophila SB210]|uniref:Kinesin motor domain protein, putative n=1 Tax=Tetrahymena thermophila (strain SB210) TaxID=312017 RepID=W7XDG9_TETTS|nr:kinesin motor domain protein, putative [Tetrahymena thermophila SB210]EWS71871.1 kinesin motor domain protein, putative [Tetrahymena thermophila SB210]|eukprot:XP_012655615.1 kinesin motor domain protein, putative [Tetrahymena thermophila SB210]